MELTTKVALTGEPPSAESRSQRGTALTGEPRSHWGCAQRNEPAKVESRHRAFDSVKRLPDEHPLWS